MKKTFYLLTLCLSIIIPHFLFAQEKNGTTVTLKQCVDFALRNQPAVKQASIDQEINEKNIRIGLSAWLPQVSSSDVYDHYLKGSPVFAPATTSGTIREYSTLGLQASQVIYNNDVLEAAKAAKYSRLYYKQNTLSSQINVVADVSKAFFDVLLSEKQLDILNEDIVRLQRSLKDAYNRYQAGVADKTDYKQATISLNNSIATRKQTAEAINSKLAYLKQIMGISSDHHLTLAYDSTRYEQEAYIDTNQKLDVNNRIEYRLLQTQKNLDNINVNYYRWGFLPSLSAVGSYNNYYLSGSLSNLYSKAYPNAYVGLSLDLPIFTGTKRLQNLSKARLQVDRSDLDIVNSANTINTEYVQAMAGYKSNYTNWQLLKQNVDLAKDVYKVVSLQYREGIKTYLDVIVSQSDLRTAELNYYNSLFQLLSSKIDLEKSLGTLNVQ
ncbi:MAG: TolC family protein [Mucilaginibacter sp.]|jgi:outer membrane protein|nr:TolC family protein [Mucilaginibacter sp.]